ncbi:MAG: LysR substrate-binding domain-containing protein [Actinomycetota bacterium]|nr:LysR substrate-binding domain-containing protein [Actinomycetota bacterium]
MQTGAELGRLLAADVAAGRLSPGDRLQPIRTLAGERGCAAGTVARAYGRLRDAGVVAGQQRSLLRVTDDGPARARALLRGETPLRLTGSDDPVLDLLLGAVREDVTVVPGPRGSVTGLGVLARGDADAAALHLLHVGTGQHNDDFARALTVGGPVTLLHLWRRDQVLVLPPGNPDGVRSPADLAGRRLAWRQPGAGSRLLLERLLRETGVAASPDHGVTVDSHLTVAIAVASGAADAGLAVRAAAEFVSATWLPVVAEPFELAIRTDRLGAVDPLLTTLASTPFRSRVRTVPGYDLSQAGAMRTAA